MAKMLWAVLCNRVITDSPTNSMSYIDCIEQVNVDQLPARLFQCSIGTMWQKTSDLDSINLRLFLKAPDQEDEQQILEIKEQVLKTERHRVNFQLDGMPVDKSGYYYFLIRQLCEGKWEKIAELNFKVIKVNKTV